MLLVPQPGRGGGGGCEGTSPSGIGTRHAVAFPARGGSGSRRASSCGAGTAGPVPQRVIKGSQPTQCMTLGLARGSAPSNPDCWGVSPWPPNHPRRGVPGKLSTTTARAPPSERKALWLSKSRAIWTRRQGFFGGALLCLHRLDPQRRKSSIIPAPVKAAISASAWSTIPATASRTPLCSTVSFPPYPRALPDRLPFPGLRHARVPRNASCADIPSQGPQVPPPVGNPEWPARSVVAIRLGPNVPTGPPRAREIGFFTRGIMGGRTSSGNS